jgi:hypothetical protein
MAVQASCWFIDNFCTVALSNNLNITNLIVLRAQRTCASHVCLAADHNSHGFIPTDDTTFNVEISTLSYHRPDRKRSCHKTDIQC